MACDCDCQMLRTIKYLIRKNIELEERLKEFEERFPEDFMKNHSFAGNRRVGGIDNKYDNK